MYEPKIPAIIYRDEIFSYQDRLNSCKCFDELYNLCDEILWELEGRLIVKQEIVDELEKIHDEVENNDYHRFVELK